MSKERILLEFNEQRYNELLEHQVKAENAFAELKEYCEETLQIEITDFASFFADPVRYCIDAYWDKYGAQFGNAPVKKEKAIELTDWSQSRTEDLFRAAKLAFSYVGPQRFKILAQEIEFNIDPEEQKTYVREEDRELYELTSEFIEVANKMEAAGGKVAWYLARYYPSLAVDGEKLIHSKSYFKSSGKFRSRGLSFIAG